MDCSGRPTPPLQPAAVIPSTCVDETRANTCGGTAFIVLRGPEGMLHEGDAQQLNQLLTCLR